MTRRQKDPLRALTPEEQAALEQLSRAPSEPASHVARARLVLAVAAGQSDTAAARGVGRRPGDAVARLVTRFNREGRAAIVPQHGGGAAAIYQEGERARILAEVRRAPDRDADGTAAWSLSTLRRALQVAPDGLPGVSEYTIWCVLRGAGRQWQRDRSWCETGVVLRQRKSGPVVVTDPAAAPKKSCSRTPIGWGPRRGWRCGRRTRRGHSRPCRTPAGTGSRRGCPPTSRTSTCAMARPSC